MVLKNMNNQSNTSKHIIQVIIQQLKVIDHGIINHDNLHILRKKDNSTKHMSTNSLYTSNKTQIQICYSLSYPNFVRGLLLDDMQPLIGRFKILGTLCCTICKSRDAPEIKRKQGYAIREIP